MLDLIEWEIWWRRLVAIMDEVGTMMVRTALSTIVGEGRNFAVVLLGRCGRSLAHLQLFTPAFTVTLPGACRHFLDAFPAEMLQPGDVLITNDSWLASGHLPDLTIWLPVFRRGASSCLHRRGGACLRHWGANRLLRRSRPHRRGFAHSSQPALQCREAQRAALSDHLGERARAPSGNRGHPRSGRCRTPWGVTVARVSGGLRSGRPGQKSRRTS